MTTPNDAGKEPDLKEPRLTRVCIDEWIAYSRALRSKLASVDAERDGLVRIVSEASQMLSALRLERDALVKSVSQHRERAEAAESKLAGVQNDADRLFAALWASRDLQRGHLVCIEGETDRECLNRTTADVVAQVDEAIRLHREGTAPHRDI